MSGGVRGTNSFSLNGAPISLTGQWQVAPNMEAIQEFKVMVNTYDAAIGRTGGGSVNTTLKSGSNNWHGSLFDYMRNSILDSNYTQNNRAGQPLRQAHHASVRRHHRRPHPQGQGLHLRQLRRFPRAASLRPSPPAPRRSICATASTSPSTA